MITVKDLTKIYTTGSTQLTVLHKINFTIKRGEFVAIVGKSGSGKSTLLYQMSLLDIPTSGDIIIDGINTKSFSEDARVSYRLNDLGYVFQEYALLPSLTALENVMTPFMMRGLSQENAESESLIVLQKVGLEEKANNLPTQLSGGQQQRVSIARAIGHSPKILYADEPTANLDTLTSKQVLSLFLDLHKSGQTIIMVTHEEEYARLAQRIITLADGRIISDKKTRK